MRLSQPLMYAVSMLALHIGDALSLRSACTTLTLTVTAQAVFAYFLCRGAELVGGNANRQLVRPLLGYGTSQVASSAPSALNARLDQLVMSQVVSAEALGVYAVATSLTSLAIPLAAAIGSVSFPRLARRQSQDGTQTLQRTAILGGLATSLVVLIIVSASAWWIIPTVFGADFSAAIELTWWLAPGGVCLATSLVAGDLLRGRGQPLAAAKAQGVGLVVTVILLACLLPTLGTRGAAIASDLAYATALVIMLFALAGPPQAVANRDTSDGGRPNRPTQHL